MIKRHNFKVLRNGLNEGIYFTTKEEAENYIIELGKRNIPGNYQIVKISERGGKND